MTNDFANGYRQADNDNSPARAAIIEAIHEARREAADVNNHQTTRAYWERKAVRWQANLDHTTRNVRVRFDGSNEKAPR